MFVLACAFVCGLESEFVCYCLCAFVCLILVMCVHVCDDVSLPV